MYYKNMGIERTGLKRVPLGVFLLGGAMVVIALLLLAAHAPRPSAGAPQRQAVLRAVTDLQGCLTCHASLAQTPVGIDGRVLSAAYHPAIQLLDHQALATVTSQVNRRLIDAGQRLIDAPAVDEHLSGQAMEEFLRLYEQVQAHPSHEAVLLDVAQQVGGLEQLIQLLENQASPFQWSRRTLPTTAPHSAVLLAGGSLPLLLDHQPVVNRAPILGASALDDNQALVLPAPVKWAVSRRGPPVVEVVESIGFREKIAI